MSPVTDIRMASTPPAVPLVGDGSGAALRPVEDPAVERSAPERRKRAPRYDVFEMRPLFEDMGDSESEPAAISAWVLIAEAVPATSDLKAIERATAGFDDERKYGTFAAPLAGTFKPRTRDREMKPVDVWS